MAGKPCDLSNHGSSIAFSLGYGAGAAGNGHLGGRPHFAADALAGPAGLLGWNRLDFDTDRPRARNVILGFFAFGATWLATNFDLHTCFHAFYSALFRN